MSISTSVPHVPHALFGTLSWGGEVKQWEMEPDLRPPRPCTCLAGVHLLDTQAVRNLLRRPWAPGMWETWEGKGSFLYHLVRRSVQL